jgi:SpoVK/Ycf46/Vps4 family AAA+-type ATPase
MSSSRRFDIVAQLSNNLKSNFIVYGELSTQMDGLAKSNALVFVLAATNLPWELDMVRRGCVSCECLRFRMCCICGKIVFFKVDI